MKLDRESVPAAIGDNSQLFSLVWLKQKLMLYEKAQFGSHIILMVYRMDLYLLRLHEGCCCRAIYDNVASFDRRDFDCKLNGYI